MGGGTVGPPTGSISVLANATSRFAYPSSPTTAFKKSSATVQSQYRQYALAMQSAAIQAQRRAAYEAKMRPIRMARAEVARAKRAERTAAIKAKNAEPTQTDIDRHSLTKSVPH